MKRKFLAVVVTAAMVAVLCRALLLRHRLTNIKQRRRRPRTARKNSQRPLPGAEK